MNNKNEEKNTHPTNNYRKWLIGILIGLIIIFADCKIKLNT